MFQNWTNTNWIIVLSGIFSNVITIAAFYFSVYSNSDIKPSYAIITLTSINVMMCAFLYFSMKESNKIYLENKETVRLNSENNIEIDRLNGSILSLSREHEVKIFGMKRVQENITMTIHNFLHQYRYIMNKILEHEKNTSADRYEILHGSFMSFIDFTLTNIKACLTNISGDECSVCIKIISDNRSIQVLRRDNVSYRIRSNFDNRHPSFPIISNSAFSKIADGHDSATYFACDNLAGNGGYVNTHDGWQSLYNATVVVPIQKIIRQGPGGEYDIVGFLCVDNLNGNLDNPTCRDFLSAIGDSLYNLFFALSEIRYNPEEVTVTLEE